MSVLFTRIGTPHPGMQAEALAYAKTRRDAVNKAYALHAEVYLRFGGPVGQVVMVETFENLAAVEKMKRAAIQDTIDHKIPTAPAGTFASVEEQAWVQL
jgi:hypothetical protein